MTTHRDIFVAGDSYRVSYFIDRSMVPDQPARMFHLQLGCDFIASVLTFQKLPVKNLSGPYIRDVQTSRLYAINGHDCIPNTKLPCLRTVETGQLFDVGLIQPDKAGQSKRFSQLKNATVAGASDIFVQWFGDQDIFPERRQGASLLQKTACNIYIQAGLPSVDFTNCADPSEARILITNVREQAVSSRVRSNLSYESTVVDILRMIRGSDSTPDRGTPFIRRICPAIFNQQRIELLFRIGSSAVLLYSINASSNVTEDARLFWRSDRPAPVHITALGHLPARRGLLTADVASAASNRAKSSNWIADAIKLNLRRQKVFFEHGLLRWFFTSKDPNSEYPLEPFRNNDVTFASRTHWFEELQNATKSEPLAVLDVQVPIKETVAHRQFWFLALEQIHERKKRHSSPEDDLAIVRRTAITWLTAREPLNTSSAGVTAPPILEIAKMKLIDRREIEDYLALNHALLAYKRGSKTPLNIAVFGPPGAGKSFGLKQLAKQCSKISKEFAADLLTFNVGQFSGIGDLNKALHQIRDECLRGHVPIAFFDEFDAIAEGRPFGWLKYFLAPMEDGEFMDNGVKYQLGSSVLVFAGGINRSFEELNSRLRNPPFAEAKGPDFISRLRAHLNIRGIHKPEDNDDQGLYYLRRAIIIRDKLTELFNEIPGGIPHRLMDRCVAEAFCKIDRFKHGVRSLQAILQMCHLRPGQPLGPSSLPSKDQLEMYVDAAQFLEFIRNAAEELDSTEST